MSYYPPAPSRRTDVFREASDCAIGLGERGAAFENQSERAALLEFKETFQGPTNPEVLLDDNAGNAKQGARLAEDSRPIGRVLASEAIH